jgi:hypothetical protein
MEEVVGSNPTRSTKIPKIWRSNPVRRRIKYFSFWGVPRTFVFEHNGQIYLLTSEFDDDLDEYPDQYEVFVISNVEGLSFSDWKSIEPLAKTLIGRVPVSSVCFDESKREYIEDSFLGEFAN